MLPWAPSVCPYVLVVGACRAICPASVCQALAVDRMASLPMVRTTSSPLVLSLPVPWIDRGISLGASTRGQMLRRGVSPARRCPWQLLLATVPVLALALAPRALLLQLQRYVAYRTAQRREERRRCVSPGLRCPWRLLRVTALVLVLALWVLASVLMVGAT